MFERLILCEYAVADLTTANANVFYELGVRHAVGLDRPSCCLRPAAGRCRSTSALLRGLPYTLERRRRPAAAEDDRRALTERLVAARAGHDRQPGVPARRRISRPRNGSRPTSSASASPIRGR